MRKVANIFFCYWATILASGGRKFKSGFTNPVFNTAFYEIRQVLYLYLDLDCIYVIYVRNYFKYLDLDLQVVDLCLPRILAAIFGES